MFVDAREIEGEVVFTSDVAVVGAGAAGLSLAVALAERGRSVTLLESGGFEPEEDTRLLYAPSSTGSFYPVPTCRLRHFGGTLNHWGGTCRPLDAFELEAHAWVPHSGWPISRAALDPFYARAAPILDLPRPVFDFDPAERGCEGLPPLLGDSEDFAPIVWRRSQPVATRIGDKYRETIRESPRLRCVLHASVGEIALDEAGGAVRELRAKSLAGTSLRLRARDFVLAGGAIENARLLLDSDARQPGGIGNGHDRVGRCFADHGFPALGWVLVSNSPDRWLREERFMRVLAPEGQRRDDTGFAATPEFRRRKRSLGFSMIAGPFDEIEADGPASKAIRALTQGPDGMRVRRPRTPPGDAPRRDLRLMGLLGVVEQSPNPESRITLSEERNALGARTAVIHHALQEADWRSVRESALAFGVAVAKAGHGRVRLAELDESRWTWGGHPSGTTRMADDPKQGVTDRDGRVHGVANLFVAGSSLFPTAGYAHPTLTIVALALRLADHLGERAKPAPS